MQVAITRYNIYSCLTFTIGDKQICCDPAKIRKEDLSTINPDLIFISHESMDHMNPTQVYFLQKKKNCKIFCSIAAAVDLIQFFPLDIDFIDSIQAMAPGSTILHEDIEIMTAQSIHCDYMLPLVFRLNFLKESIALLHCFDTHLSEEIIQLSEGTDLAIIPIGIAKGVSPVTGFEFAQHLKSRYFITNHFKDEEELHAFHQLIKNSSNKERFFLIDWDKSCHINLTLLHKCRATIQSYEENLDIIYEKILQKQELSLDQLKTFLAYFYVNRCRLLGNTTIIKDLLEGYPIASENHKKLILIVAAVVCLLNAELADDNFIKAVKIDALSPSTDEINSLKARALFFLGLCSQQKGKNLYLTEILSMVDDPSDHINYWIVEFLGRCATSKSENYEKAIDALISITQIPHLYQSVVVRRKLFWEFHRIMKYLPQFSNRFFTIFEDGLEDSNPDVRLLAILCFSLANRIYYLSTAQIAKISALLEDPEDDVRETALKAIGILSKSQRADVIKNLNDIKKLLEYKNCHVQFAAKETWDLLNV